MNIVIIVKKCFKKEKNIIEQIVILGKMSINHAFAHTKPPAFFA